MLLCSYTESRRVSTWVPKQRWFPVRSTTPPVPSCLTENLGMSFLPILKEFGRGGQGNAVSIAYKTGLRYRRCRFVNKAKRGSLHQLRRSFLTIGILSSHNVCLSPVSRGIRTYSVVSQTDGNQRDGATKNEVSTSKVRASDLSARARQPMMNRPSDGQTVLLFSVWSVFNASSARNSAYSRARG